MLNKKIISKQIIFICSEYLSWTALIIFKMISISKKLLNKIYLYTPSESQFKYKI